MRVFTPEISWHNRLPALSLDISSAVDDSENVYRVATGGNDCRVYIWQIDLGKSKIGDNSRPPPEIKIRAGLRRHQKSVGAVRFSAQHMLASGDDDGYIYLWKYKQDIEHDESEPNAFLNDDGFEDLELWQQQRVLRGHIEDICDLSWSKDGQYLISGSVDNSAILWDITKGTKIWCSDLIKGYVQGVTFDPHNHFMAALSSDRTLRVYNFSDRRLINATRRMNLKGKYKAFFCDDTVQTFCRRLEFSPDGQFLAVPTSRIQEKDPKPTQATSAKTQLTNNDNAAASELMNSEVPSKDKQIDVIDLTSPKRSDECEGNDVQPIEVEEDDTAKPSSDQVAEQPSLKDDNPVPKEVKKRKKGKPMNVFLIFRRTSLNKPVHYYPTGREIALCIRFSPVVYTLRENEENFWDIPYRIVFAVATSRSLLIYDSQQSTPLGYVSQIHLARLTDLSWSNDGRFLMVSSYDGYSTLVTFDRGEFGEIYTSPLLDPISKPLVPPTVTEEEKIETVEQSETERSFDEKDKESKKAHKRIKLPESATMWRYLIKK